LSTTYKMVSNILLSRLTPYAEEIIGDHQCEFRRSRSTTDHIICIRQILEKKNGNTMKQCIIYKTYCITVHFRRITSIFQPTNAHTISHKTLLKHSDMFRSSQIIIRELCSLLNLYYSIGICKRGVVAAYRVV